MIRAIFLPADPGEATVLDVIQKALAEGMVACYEIVSGRWAYFPPHAIPPGWRKFAAVQIERRAA